MYLVETKHSKIENSTKRIEIRKLWTVILVIGLIISITHPIKVYAADNVSTYSNKFSDVAQGSYYSDSVYKLHRKGIVSGYNSSTFGPNDRVTNYQILLMLGRLVGAEYLNKPTTVEAVISWASGYGINVANIINNPATRDEVANYIYKVGQFNKLYTSISEDTQSKTLHSKIEDLVTEDGKIINIPIDMVPTSGQPQIFADTNADYVNNLYRLGIINGVIESNTRKFKGSQLITRAEACVMVDRLDSCIDSIEKSKENQYLSLLDRGYFEVAEPNSLSTPSDFIQAWSYMLANHLTTWTFEFPINEFKSTEDLKSKGSEILSYVHQASLLYPEYSGYYERYSIKPSYKTTPQGILSAVTLEFVLKDNMTTEEYLNKINTVENELNKVIEKLISDGKINDTMTDREVALEYYKYLSQRITYDYGYNNYTTYDTLINNTGVCQGYSGLLAYMLHISGIPARSVRGDTLNKEYHEWTMIPYNTFDRYIDLTWGDTDNSKVYTEDWFWVTKDYLETTEKWRVFE